MRFVFLLFCLQCALTRELAFVCQPCPFGRQQNKREVCCAYYILPGQSFSSALLRLRKTTINAHKMLCPNCSARACTHSIEYEYNTNTDSLVRRMHLLIAMTVAPVGNSHAHSIRHKTSSARTRRVRQRAQWAMVARCVYLIDLESRMAVFA